MSPNNPLKRKAKGKEASPGYFGIPLSPRAYARPRKGVGRYRFAEAASHEVMNILGSHNQNDFRLWAWYCYRHDVGIIFDKAYELASLARCGEVRNPITAFQRWLTDTFAEDVR